MGVYILTDVEQKLIKKYQETKDDDIALYFFNKLGNDILNIIYSKINAKFNSIPFEREDLTSIVWKNLKSSLEKYKSDKKSLWNNWINFSYFSSVREISKYFKNTELVLNFAGSWENLQQTHLVLNRATNIVEKPKIDFKLIITPIVDYVVQHNKTYKRADIKKLLYLKSFGYSEREIAKKMNVSRRYISSMIKIVLRISKRFLCTSNR